MKKPAYDRLILSLTDVELEQFVRDWASSKGSIYFEVTRFAGTSDFGRDVVGFLSKEKHEGDWHNYQCKQYGKPLPTNTGICEIGKILYYAFMKQFSVPTKYLFVAPRGINRNLEKLIFNPTLFKKEIIDEWDKYCAKNIIDGDTIKLDKALKDFICDFDFSVISRVNLDDMLCDPSITPVLFKWFGAAPGEAPKGDVPTSIESTELNYINKLVKAYAEREGVIFSSHEDIASYPEHSNHLSRQRERYYDADAFKRFYRDNTDQSTIDSFSNDVYHGVVDICNANHQDALSRVDAVMAQAANVKPSGPLAEYARVPVKQGICHHFANEDLLKWQK